MRPTPGQGVGLEKCNRICRVYDNSVNDELNRTRSAGIRSRNE